MSRLRRMLGPIAALWLLCQVSGTTAASIAFLIDGSTHAVECTCSHGDHAICPMHHRPTPDTRCSIRASTASGGAILSSLLIGVGILTPAMATVAPAATAVGARADSAAASLRPTPPDPPPPRA